MVTQALHIPLATFLFLGIPGFGTLFGLCIFILWIWAAVHAIRKRPDNFGAIVFVSLFFGPLGSLFALFVLARPKKPETRSLAADARVIPCPHCATALRLSDYRKDVDAVCSTCRQVVRAAMTPEEIEEALVAEREIEAAALKVVEQLEGNRGGSDSMRLIDNDTIFYHSANHCRIQFLPMADWEYCCAELERRMALDESERGGADRPTSENEIDDDLPVPFSALSMSVATLDSALDANLVEFATVLTGDEDQSHLEPYTRAWGEAEYAIFADHENDIVDALWLDVAEAVFLDVDAMAMVIETIPRVDELLLIDWSYLHFFPLSRRDQLREYLLFLRWNAILMRALSNPSLALMQWTPDALAFGHEVIATGSVWALRDMRGLLLPSDPTGQRYLQLWSTPERLTETIKRARGYDSYVVVEIGKQALCELILPQLEEERIPIVANWDGYGSGGLSLTVDAKRWKPRIPASDLGPEYN